MPDPSGPTVPVRVPDHPTELGGPAPVHSSWAPPASPQSAHQSAPRHTGPQGKDTAQPPASLKHRKSASRQALQAFYRVERGGPRASAFSSCSPCFNRDRFCFSSRCRAEASTKVRACTASIKLMLKNVPWQAGLGVGSRGYTAEGPQWTLKGLKSQGMSPVAERRGGSKHVARDPALLVHSKSPAHSRIQPQLFITAKMFVFYAEKTEKKIVNSPVP